MQIPIVDCDIHPRPNRDTALDKFLDPKFREAVALGLAGQPGTGYSNPFGVDRRDAKCDVPADVARDHLDRYGIVYGMLQPPGMDCSVTHDIDVGTGLARAWNRWQADVWLAADKRFLGSICVNMNDPVNAAAIIREWAQHPQMKQVLACGASWQMYGHRQYHAVYDACNETGLPFCVHPGREGCIQPSTPIGNPRNYFEWHTLIPLTYQAHLVSLIAEGVFEKFPRMKVILCEGGVAWVAHTMWRMEKNFKALRAVTPWLKRLPSEYIMDHVRLTTQPLEEPAKGDQILQIFEMINAHRTLMFATDFPHWDFDDPARVFPRSMNEGLRERIFYKTAAETFNLDIPVVATTNQMVTA